MIAPLIWCVPGSPKQYGYVMEWVETVRVTAGRLPGNTKFLYSPSEETRTSVLASRRAFSMSAVASWRSLTISPTSSSVVFLLRRGEASRKGLYFKVGGAAQEVRLLLPLCT